MYNLIYFCMYRQYSLIRTYNIKLAVLTKISQRDVCALTVSFCFFLFCILFSWICKQYFLRKMLFLIKSCSGIKMLWLANLFPKVLHSTSMQLNMSETSCRIFNSLLWNCIFVLYRFHKYVEVLSWLSRPLWRLEHGCCSDWSEFAVTDALVYKRFQRKKKARCYTIKMIKGRRIGQNFTLVLLFPTPRVNPYVDRCRFYFIAFFS